MPPSAREVSVTRRRAERAFAEPSADPAAVMDAFVEILSGPLGVTSACWHLTDPGSGFPIEGGVVADPPGSFEEGLVYEFRRPDVNRFAELAKRRTGVAAALSAETGGRPHESARFREMVAPGGAADELRVSLGDAYGIWGTAVLFTDRRLEEDDVHLAAGLAPLASAALRGARARSAAPPAEGGPAVLVVDPEDRVVAADPVAAARLEALADGRDAPLPGVLSYLTARLRGCGGDTPVTARARTTAGAWLTLDASSLGDGTIAIVTQPAPAYGRLDLALRAHGLTDREREVATLAVQGRSTRAIAEALVVSPWTVQDHLKSIFEKTSVSSRGELAELTARDVAGA